MSIEQKYRLKQSKRHPGIKTTVKYATEETAQAWEKFPLIGISSTLKEYTFCHFLSQKLGVSFARQNDIIYPNPKEGSSLTFSIYHAMTPLEEQELLVFVNKCRYSVLAEEYSEMEFLLRINGSDDALFISKTVEAIREISGVLWVGELDSRVLRHPGRVFWEMPSVISPPHSLKRVKFIR